MNRVRYSLVIIVVLLCAVLLQTLKVVDFLPEFLWINAQQSDIQQSKRLLTTPTDEIPVDSKVYQVIYDSSISNPKSVFHQLEQAFRNAHLRMRRIDSRAEDFDKQLEEIDSDDHILIAGEFTQRLTDEQLSYISELVREGAYLDILIRSYDPRIEELTGFSQGDFIETGGVVFEGPLFPWLDTLTPECQNIESSSLSGTLLEDSRVRMSSSDGVPIVWTHPWGKGSVQFMNTTMFQDKLNRGLLLQYILDHDSYSVSTVFNYILFNIDDFPAPVPPGRHEKIFPEYQRTTEKFYREVWWSDIRDLGARYDLKLTGLAIGSYNADTKPPLEPFLDHDIENIIYFARKLNEIDGEIGIHGYNHNSLVLAGEADFEELNYTAWASIEDMSASLNYLTEELDSQLGRIPYHTYVPPSNIATLATKKALIKALPDLKVIASLYTGCLQDKGTLIQELGEDPDIPGVYDLPRFSSGYIMDMTTEWRITNAMAEIGMVNHFIHPDDLLDEDRSMGMSWEELYDGLTEIIQKTKEEYPFLIPATDYEAYLAYLDYEKMSIYTTKEDNIIRIFLSEAPSPTYCYLRLKKPVRKTSGLTLIPSGQDDLYIIKITSAQSSIELLP